MLFHNAMLLTQALMRFRTAPRDPGVQYTLIVFRHRGRKTGSRLAGEQFCSPDRTFLAAHGFGWDLRRPANGRIQADLSNFLIQVVFNLLGN